MLEDAAWAMLYILNSCRQGEWEMQRGGHEAIGEKGMVDLQVVNVIWNGDEEVWSA